MEPATDSIAYADTAVPDPPAKGNVYLIGFGFLAAALGVAALWLMGDHTTIKLIQAFAFLLLGYGFSVVAAARLSHLGNTGQWLYVLLLTALIAGAVAAGYFVYSRLHWPAVVLSAGSFLLPFAVGKTREAFNEVSGQLPAPWFYSPGLTSRPAVVSLHSTPIRMKVGPRADEARTDLISFSAPGRMRIGDILFHIVSEQNNTDHTIEWADGEGNPYGWVFYKSYLGGLFKKYLQPEGSLIDNNVGRNAVVVAERVWPVTE